MSRVRFGLVVKGLVCSINLEYGLVKGLKRLDIRF